MQTPHLAMRLISAWKTGHNMGSRIGLMRSILIYYGVPGRRARLSRFYSQFLEAGDLAFDVGAHVGNRILAWQDIGSTIVAFEPQSSCMTLLRHWYASAPNVTLVSTAIGSKPGEAVLHISEKTPAVTTLSSAWQNDVQQADSFAHVLWEEQVAVSLSTLDEQIAHYGLPTFCKIDVEGYELEVLRGLSQPIQTVSIEYIPATPKATLACIDRLMALGSYQFNWSVGETHHLQSKSWLSAAEATALMQGMGINDASGDLYARITSLSSSTSSTLTPGPAP